MFYMNSDQLELILFIEKVFNEAHLLTIYKDYMINSTTV